MGKPKQIRIGDKSSGVIIEYVKSRKTIYVNGWYDTIVGIEGVEMSLDAFCEQLGIQRKDLPE